jgi:hypothetical protein
MGFPVFPLDWKTEGVSSGYREKDFSEAVINF